MREGGREEKVGLCNASKSDGSAGVADNDDNGIRLDLTAGTGGAILFLVGVGILLVGDRHRLFRRPEASAESGSCRY